MMHEENKPTGKDYGVNPEDPKLGNLLNGEPDHSYVIMRKQTRRRRCCTGSKTIKMTSM